MGSFGGNGRDQPCLWRGGIVSSGFGLPALRGDDFLFGQEIEDGFFGVGPGGGGGGSRGLRLNEVDVGVGAGGFEGFGEALVLATGRPCRSRRDREQGRGVLADVGHGADLFGNVLPVGDGMVGAIGRRNRWRGGRGNRRGRSR